MLDRDRASVKQRPANCTLVVLSPHQIFNHMWGVAAQEHDWIVNVQSIDSRLALYAYEVTTTGKPPFEVAPAEGTQKARTGKDIAAELEAWLNKPPTMSTD